MNHTIFRYDPLLKAYEKDFDLRKQNYENKKKALLKEHSSLRDFASGHLYFGFHKTKEGWYYREWAPGAQQVFLTGDFCNWDRYAHPMEKGENGVFSLFLPGSDTLRHGQKVMAIVVSDGKGAGTDPPLYPSGGAGSPDHRLERCHLRSPGNIPMDR